MIRYKTIISELRIAGIVGTLFIVSMTSGWTDNLGIASMPCGNTLRQMVWSHPGFTVRRKPKRTFCKLALFRATHTPMFF